jgi:hypothetical protein
MSGNYPNLIGEKAQVSKIKKYICPLRIQKKTIRE